MSHPHTTHNQREERRMTTKTTDTLTHAEWCKAERIETTDYPEVGRTTTHCVDCGAHGATDSNGKTIPIPAVTGGLVDLGRGDMDVTMERAQLSDRPGVRR